MSDNVNFNMKGVYVHIPFCRQKCSYCDFVSYTKRERDFAAYLDAIYAQMKKYRREAADSVYIGGGTPTILSAEMLTSLTNKIRGNFRLTPDVEFSTEANPGTLSDEKLFALRRGGVNRLSIGVQSFNDNELKIIGRIHDAKTAVKTVEAAANAGFDNISIDLMLALPSQTQKSLMHSLEAAVTLPIKHISVYSLIPEPGTPLAARRDALQLPSEDEDRDMYAAAVAFLSKHGFEQYEISNFSKPNFQCRHNIRYWRCGEYIGIGAAAHSYIGKTRFSNPDDLEKYMRGEQGKSITLERSDEISEFMMLGLRMNRGISLAEFKMKFGAELAEIFPGEAEKFVRAGAAKLENGRFFLTPRGMDIANTVMCEFML